MSVFTLLCFTAADTCITQTELVIDPRATRVVLKSECEIRKQQQRGFLEKG